MRTPSVVGALLNFQDEWKAMEPAMHQEPHFKPPQHVALYLKPVNTFSHDGAAIVLPAGVNEVRVGATLGVVIGRPAARVPESAALDFVGGYVAVNDVTVPHQAVLRPPIKQKCRAGFCPIGTQVPAAAVTDPNALQLRAFVNGELKSTHSLRELIRPVARLLAEVTEFMTLEPGDILLVGVPFGVPLARAGDEVAVDIDGVGRVTNRIRAQEELA